jgi:hypothetical protein
VSVHHAIADDVPAAGDRFVDFLWFVVVCHF